MGAQVNLVAGVREKRPSFHTEFLDAKRGRAAALAWHLDIAPTNISPWKKGRAMDYIHSDYDQEEQKKTL